MKIFIDTGAKILRVEGREYPCALGKNGVVPYELGREGDGKTPLGTYKTRYGLYRKDRVELPETELQFWPIHINDGWCDAPDDPAYNRPIQSPYPASFEKLWRESQVYDIIIVLSHNDAPPVPGLGSAIFLHVSRENYTPTQGCVAISRADMLELLTIISRNNFIIIE